MEVDPKRNQPSLLGGLGGLLGEKDSLDVGQDTTLGDGDSAEKLVQLLVVADSQLQVTGDDTGLLVVAGGVASQLEDLSSQVLEYGSQVYWGSSTDTGSVVSLAEESVNTTDWELKSCTSRSALSLGTGLSTSFSTSRHDDCIAYLLREHKKVELNNCGASK